MSRLIRYIPHQWPKFAHYFSWPLSASSKIPKKTTKLINITSPPKNKTSQTNNISESKIDQKKKKIVLVG